MKWEWQKDSPLYDFNLNTSCQDIFNAVSNEIAKYYLSKGWKYSKSRPKLTYDDSSIKVEIGFWSSRSNIPGNWVNLEIIPSIYSMGLKKQLKSKGIDSKGYILGHPEIFYEKLEGIPKGIKRVFTILEGVTEFEENYEETSVLRHNNNINIYGINENNFMEIIDFINDKIVVWKDLISDYEKLKAKLITFRRSDLQQIKTGDFAKYIEFKFPEFLEDFRNMEN